MNYIYVILIISFVILIHELGHFIAARIVQIPIQTFSIGFGPKLWGFTRNNTEYRISAIPLGGYVLPAVEDNTAFFTIPVNKRIIMSAGGPLASLLLPVLCFSILNISSGSVSLYAVFVKPFIQTVSLLTGLLATIPQVITNTENLSGIVGIVSQGGQYVGHDYSKLIAFTALLSMNFFVLNMLPFPVLDGGKIILTLSEKIHPQLRKLHVPLSVAGWLLILGLMLYVTVRDIGKLVS